MENKERMFGEGIARQELNVLFVIDNSGSMAGERIGSVNNAIRDVMSIMPEIQEDTADAVIKISALKFSDEAKWIYSEPQSVSEFRWKDLSADGGTNLSDAYEKLAKWLCKKEKGGQMPDIGGVAPIIILMTDGMPTSYNWKDKLDDLKKKGWFKVALKYALAIGIDTDEAMNVLNKFTGNPETVLKVYSAEALRKVIKVIAITASKVKSSSATTAGGFGQQANQVAQEQITNKLDEIQDVEW
ncbi:MAG: VWA domain-containing protein [Clostridia bacterium]|nr:VWA domain-containing protein [Clostridia bacterium]